MYIFPGFSITFRRIVLCLSTLVIMCIYTFYARMLNENGRSDYVEGSKVLSRKI